MTDSPPIPFTKMHGAGNDFVFLTAADLASHGKLSAAEIAWLCNRRTGIGADGLIIIGPAPDADFAMDYYNADGGPADMCGNGARCSVAFAHEHGLCADTCTFRSPAGLHTGQRHSVRDVTVSLTGWRELDLDLKLSGSPFDLHCSCNTGVPHLVIPVADTEAVDVIKWGSRLRHHEVFGPAGTNVNWVDKDPATGVYRLRTYERGVEDETLACGTGASATAVVLCQLGKAESPVAILTRGGDLLRITVDGGTGNLQLRGPALVSFTGRVAIPAACGKERGV